MVAYNFQKQFADDVESGKKTQTIRKAGKRNPPKVGDALQLYTGMRTKSCRKLADVICTDIRVIKIVPKFGEVLLRLADGINWVIIDSKHNLHQLALDDGFNSEEEFFAYFEKDTDENDMFHGHLIRWESIK